MLYALFIYQDERVLDSLERVDQEQLFAEYIEYTDALLVRDKVVAGEALESASEAVTLRVNGKDGAVTKGTVAKGSTLGGFYVIDVKDLDEALDWAAEIPDVKLGASVEVRRVMSYP